VIVASLADIVDMLIERHHHHHYHHHQQQQQQHHRHFIKWPKYLNNKLFLGPHQYLVRQIKRGPDVNDSIDVFRGCLEAESDGTDMTGL